MIQLLLDNILFMDNEQLYEVYVQALKERDLNVLNVVRSIIADRYCLSELKKSPLDEPFKNPDIARFFTVKM